MSHRTFEVGLHGIVCLDTGNDEDNDELEIRGTQWLQAGMSLNQLRENRQMWHLEDNDGVSIKPGEHNVHIIRDFQTIAIFEGEFLRFGGHIAEEDVFNADDYMGGRHIFTLLRREDFDALPPDGEHFPIEFIDLQRRQKVRVDYTVKEIH